MSKCKTSNKTPTCFVISSPSGAGKTTLVNRALQVLEGVEKTVSHTTRAPRPGEQDGRDYFFIAKQDFEQQVQAGQFAEHVRVYDHLYGTSKKTIEAILSQGKDAILVIENQGAKEVVKHFERVVLICIKPPSMEVLQARLQARPGSKSDDIDERLKQAARELQDMSWYEHFIINDDIERALGQLVDLIRTHR